MGEGVCECEEVGWVSEVGWVNYVEVEGVLGRVGSGVLEIWGLTKMENRTGKK